MRPFCAWHPDPEADCIDAFLQDWSKYDIVYIFPPFAVLPAVLQKFVADGASGVIVAPFWPTKPWFTRLTEPVIFEATKENVFLCSSDMQHPMGKKLKLLICLYSSEPCRQQEFRQELDRRYGGQGDDCLTSFTKHIGIDGRNIVSKGRLIPLRPLQDRH